MPKYEQINHFLKICSYFFKKKFRALTIKKNMVTKKASPRPYVQDHEGMDVFLSTMCNLFFVIRPWYSSNKDWYVLEWIIACLVRRVA